MTDRSDLGKIHSAIGELTGEIKGMRREMDQSEKRAVERERRANDARGRLHQRLDVQARQISSVEHRLETIEQREAKTSAFVDQQRELESGRRVAWKIARTIGTPAWTAVKWIGGTALMALVAFWRELNHYLAGG